MKTIYDNIFMEATLDNNRALLILFPASATFLGKRIARKNKFGGIFLAQTKTIKNHTNCRHSLTVNKGSSHTA